MKKILGYENYFITEDGQVINSNTGRKLKPQTNNCGYLRVELCGKGEKKKHFIHRLVALAYLPNLSELPQVNHKDGVKTNNNVNNLEWCSASKNMRHSFGELNRKPTKLYDQNNGKTKIPKSEIPEVIKLSKSKTYQEIAKIYDCNPKYIGMIVRGERRND